MSKKNNPVTAYLSVCIFSIIGIINIVFALVHIFSAGVLSANVFLESFYISWTNIPYFLIEIAENEISFFTVLMYIAVAIIISVYFALPIIALKKRSKNINGILMVVLFIDIVLSAPMLLAEPIVGIINISIKAFLCFLCLRNIKWYNENYEIV